MATLTPEELKILNRRVDRQLARQGREDHKLSTYILIAEGDLYQGRPVYKALLKEIAFLAPITEPTDGNKPTGRERIPYKGWCYMGQARLARRVGCEPTYACRVLNQMVKDGVLKIRSYRTKDGNKHCEYKIVEEVAKAHHGVTDDKSDGEPPVIKTTSHLSLSQGVVDIRTSTPLSLSPEPPVIKSSEADSQPVSKVESKADFYSQTPSASPRRTLAVASLLPPSEGKPRGTSSPEPPTPSGRGGLKPETKPVQSSGGLNKKEKSLADYLDDEDDEPCPCGSPNKSRVHDCPLFDLEDL